MKILSNLKFFMTTFISEISDFQYVLNISDLTGK